MNTHPSLLLLLPILALAGARVSPRGVVESFGIDNGLDRGDWGPIEICPDKSYAFAFEIKYSGIGFLDDTCTNAIRMYCRDSSGALTGTTMSSEGEYGQWQGMRTCAGGEFLKGMRANVVPEMGISGDDLGVDNFQMQCTDDTVLDGLDGNTSGNHTDTVTRTVTRDLQEVDGRELEKVYFKIELSELMRDYGDWGSWVECSPGNRVCGHETRLEKSQTFDDDAGIVDVIMFCCNVS